MRRATLADWLIGLGAGSLVIAASVHNLILGGLVFGVLAILIGMFLAFAEGLR